MSSQPRGKNLKRTPNAELLPIRNVPTPHCPAIERACPEVPPSTPKRSLQLSNVVMKVEDDFSHFVNILWAPKRPRLIKRLNRDKIQPKRLLFEEEENEDHGLMTPKRRSQLAPDQVQRLLMAPKRLAGRREKNPNIRPVRLFQKFDHGYMTDEDPLSETSNTSGFSLTPGKKPLDDSLLG